MPGDLINRFEVVQVEHFRAVAPKRFLRRTPTDAVPMVKVWGISNLFGEFFLDAYTFAADATITLAN